MTRLSTRIGSMIVFCLAATGCAYDRDGASSGPRQPRQCFWPSSVSNFRVVDSRTVNIRVGRDVYRLDMFGTCSDLSWSNRLGLTTSGGSTICAGSSLGTSIVVRGPNREQRRCPVQTITVLTPEQVTALPARERP